MRAAAILIAIIGTGCQGGRNNKEPDVAEIKSGGAQSPHDGGEGAVRKVLDELPGLLVADVPTKPDYDRGTSQLILDVAIKVDQKKYTAIRDRLVGVLEGIARAKGSTLIDTHRAGHRTDSGRVVLNVNENIPALAGPDTVQTGDKSWCVWVASFSNEERTRSRWNYYLVDLDLGKIHQSNDFPWKLGGERPSSNPKQGTVLVNLSFIDKDGSQVTEDEFELPASTDVEERAVIRHSISLPDAGNYLYLAPCFFEVTHSQASSDRGIEQRWGLSYLTDLSIRRTIKVTASEAKRIERVQAKTSLRPGGSTDSDSRPKSGR